MTAPRTRFIAGCMTGTSLDGLDVALAEVCGTRLEMSARFVAMVSLPLGELRQELRHFAEGRPAEPIRYLRAARRLGELHATAVGELLRRHGDASGGKLDFIVVHGQTIWHAPADREASAAAGLSWQLMDPWPIVCKLGVPVCYDLRQADLIAGGQGAPITPLADWVLFGDARRSRVIVNLGGICNISALGRRQAEPRVTGGDVGPCNILIDGVVREMFPQREYDQDGRIASAGRAGPLVLELVRASPFFHRRGVHSTGREDFGREFIASVVSQARQRLSAADVVASAVDAAAQIVVEGVRAADAADDVVLAGGGARNPALVKAIRQRCEPACRVMTSQELGVPVEAREALEFAVLGALSQDGVPITLPQVTGSNAPGRAGTWVYP